MQSVVSTWQDSPAEEEERLKALADYDILETSAEPEFDEITRLAVLVLGAESSAISLIDDSRQWFKSRVGIDFEETPREQAFCAHAVAARDFVEVSNATRDPRFADNPLVTNDNGIRFYAGAPLIMTSGHCLGTLCVFDSQVRQPVSSNERQALQYLAKIVVQRIEQRGERITREMAAKVIRATSDAILSVDGSGLITFWNDGAERMFGLAKSEAVGQSLDLILPNGPTATAHHRGFHRLVTGQDPSLIGGTVELTAKRASGEQFAIELSSARWGGQDAGDESGFAAIIRDVSDRKKLEHDRARTRAFLDAIVRHLPAMLFVKDSVSRKYVLLNKAGEDIIERPASEIIGRTDHELFPEMGLKYADRDTSVLRSEEVEIFESEFPRDGGRNLTLRTKRIVIDAPDNGGKYILGLTEDVTELRKSERQVLYLAHHDPLTGLCNRTNFVDTLARLISAKSRLALLTIDLDRFKAVNDQFGHPTGDKVLIDVASRLRQLVGPNDIVARIGGDEFSVIVVDEQPASRAEHIAKAIIARLSAPYEVDHFVAHLGASIGIVVTPDDGENVEALRQAADLALYRAKSLGRGMTAFFSAELDEVASDRRFLETELRKAIDDHQITVAYQPVLSASNGAISSFEALARWNHPERGPIPPAIFIPIAEECGLVEKLGAQILKTACATAATWREDIRIAVNLSPMQFDSPDLCQTISDILEHSGLCPNRLQLEVTEGLVIRDVDRTFRILTQLRMLGVQILMDDFGVGYSSLSYFERFPFDKVKIDRSFVAKLSVSPAAKAIVEAIVSLGRALDMGVVAEGVETEEQMLVLAELGITHMQGYLFTDAKPAAAFPQVLRGANIDTVRRQHQSRR